MFFDTKRAVTLEAVQIVLREERMAKEEILANKQSIERKSKEFIENQQRKLEELNQAKVRARPYIVTTTSDQLHLSHTLLLSILYSSSFGLTTFPKYCSRVNLRLNPR